MPIYEFRCSQCGQDVELLMKFSDPHPASCPHCNRDGTLIKRISQTSFVLKGGGWYETDFKTKPAAPAPAAEPAAATPAPEAAPSTPAPTQAKEPG